MSTLHRRRFLCLAAAAWATIPRAQANAAPVGLSQVNVKHYGATGDGTTDDTAAIHAARDAAGIGGRVFFPAGNYLVSGLWADVASQTWQLSDGAVITRKAGSPHVLRVLGAGFTVTGGVLDGNTGTVHDGSERVMVVTNGGGALIEKVTVRNSPYIGVEAYNVNNVKVIGCTFTANYGGSIFCQNNLAGPSNIYDITITDNLIEESASQTDHASGIGVFGSSKEQRINRVTISGNKIILPYNQKSDSTGCIGPINCTDVVVLDNVCIGSAISISCQNAVRGVIANNEVRGFSMIGIELPVDPRHGPAEVNSVSVAGNVIDPDGTSAAGGIETSAFGSGSTGDIKNLSITGNTIRNFAGGNLINFNSGSKCRNISIVGNALTPIFSSRQVNGIMFNADVTDLAVSGNIVDGASTLSAYGIQFLRSVSEASISGNRFSNIADAAVLLGASGDAHTLDYIKFFGNILLNCASTLKDATANGAAVGNNVFVGVNME